MEEYPVGTSLILQVMAGDRITLEVKNRYDSYNSSTDNLISDQSFFQKLLSTMVTGPEGSPAEQGQVQLISSLFGSQNMSIFEMMSDMALNPARPPAALNYILYNNQLQIVGGGSGVIQADGLVAWSVIGTDGEIEIPENGFLSVFLSKRSLVTPVYFDDLRIGIRRGSLREENHYYPHGLPMAHMGTEAPGSIENRQKHQSNEYIKDLGLNWMDFAARQYDPQIGRFLGVDPLGDYYRQDRYSPYAAMGNQPESMVDPNGLAFGSTWFTPNASGPEQWGLSLGMAASSLDFMVKGLTNKSPIFPAHGGGGGTWGANGQGATLTINGQTMQLSMNGLALLLGGLSSGNLSINALSVNDITEEGTGSQPTEEGSSLVGSGSPGEQQQSPSSSGSGGLLSQIFKGKSVTNLSPVAQDMPAGSATSNYCVYACFEMILNKYGDQTNQKSIELAAIWTGLSPGINQGVRTEDIPYLGSLLGLKSTELMDGNLEYLQLH